MTETAEELRTRLMREHEAAQRPSREDREGDAQPLPKESDSPIMHDLVRADLLKRLQLGIERYGQPLQANNGRDALMDAYEEALDLTVYLRQAIYERDGR